VAVAGSRTAAMLLALWRPGLTIVPSGEEGRELAGLPLAALERLDALSVERSASRAQSPNRQIGKSANRQIAKSENCAFPILDLFRRWGLKTLGDLAMLPAAALSARIGQDGLRWQRVARGEDLEPLVAMPPEAPLEETLDLDWPVEGLEPLSFLLPRVLEPLCDRLERLDQAAVALTLTVHLATREQETRRLELPAPMRDAKVLRTLVLLHLESHPLGGGVDRLTVLVQPAPARIVQFSLLARALPFPEQMATLLARLSALMGERRVGAAEMVDSFRPGAFAVRPFSVSESSPAYRVRGGRSLALGARHAALGTSHSSSPQPLAPGVVLRRFRLPVPARVAVQEGRPVRVTTERHGLEGGRVEASAGPWRTSGEWWRVADARLQASPAGTVPEPPAGTALSVGWNRDEWDVSLSDGAVYRIYRDRVRERWFVDGIVD
jgi:protein ImuB